MQERDKLAQTYTSSQNEKKNSWMLSENQTMYGVAMKGNINLDEEYKSKGDDTSLNYTRMAWHPAESSVQLEASDHIDRQRGSSLQPLGLPQPETGTSIDTNAAILLMDEISKDMPETTGVVVDCKFLVDLNHSAMTAMRQGKFDKARKSLRLCELLANDMSVKTLAMDER